jgi:cell division protein FtsW
MAVEVEEIRKIKKKPLDFGLLITLLIIMSLGLIMVLSASAPYAYTTTGNSYHYVNRQLLSAALGLGGMFIISWIDYRIYKKWATISLIIAFVLLVAVFIPGIGVTRNEATRWIGIGDRTIQPSELMKVALIVFFSAKLSEDPQKIKKFITGLLPYLIILVAIVGLLLLEPHMSAAMIILVVGFTLLFCGGAKISHFIPMGIAGICGAAVLAVTEEYRLRRILIFLNPWSDPRGDGWQIIQSLYAIGSGGLFGVGLR